MSFLPIVEHFQARPTAGQQEQVERFARHLRRREDLFSGSHDRRLVVERLEDGPTLHLDDLSDIPLLDRAYDVTFMQERARLRADDGDFVATCTSVDEHYQSYCRERLGLGVPEGLQPVPHADPLNVAQACWQDRHVRSTLVRALRTDRLRYIHPHMGTLSVWELGVLLHKASRRPVKIIAPPPGLTRFVNDKLEFAEVVRGLLGEHFVPRTEEAANFAVLAARVSELAVSSQFIGIKLPNSAGGGGNLVIDAARFRGISLHAIRDLLSKLLERLDWHGERRLLVDSWETEVLCAPSAQFWIPPEADGLPVTEGLFEQLIEGEEGMFMGSRPVRVSQDMQQEIVDRSWLLARLFQRLGYVGRCSLDMLLVGKRIEESRLEFIECNGRWGGTSLPMTLMNRLFGDWQSRPYAARETRVAGLNRLEFADLLGHFEEDLFDVRTGKGTLILYNPGRMQAHSGINVIAMAPTWDEAASELESEFPRRLAELVRSRTSP